MEATKNLDELRYRGLGSDAESLLKDGADALNSGAARARW
jgi:hypothetical protein